MDNKELVIKFIKENLGQVIIGKDNIGRMIIGYISYTRTNKIRVIYVKINNEYSRQCEQDGLEWKIMINELGENKTFVYSADINHLRLRLGGY